MKLLVYDVETAQKKNIGSICSVGWVSLDNDVIVDQGCSLINPHCSFSKANTEVHGLCSADVANAPSFGDYWKSVLSPLMSSHLVISHSAGFDLSATEQALFAEGIEDPGIDYLDSLALFRSLFQSPSYKLTDLALVAGLNDYIAHNASNDAVVLTKVLFFIRDALHYEDIASMIIRSPVRAENTKTNNYVPKKIDSIFQGFPQRTHCNEFVQQKSCIFSDKRFCITGDIPGYERADLERIIMENGGCVTSGVSGKTNYLVVGVYPDYPADFVSSKLKKTRELNEAGRSICILSPDDFFSLLAKVSTSE